MTSNPNQSSFLLTSTNANQSNSESLVDRKLNNRQELFSNENTISTIKQEAISSDLSLGNNEREKLFKSRRLKQKIKIENTESIITKLSIPKDFYDKCNSMEVNINQLAEFITKVKSDNNAQFQYEGLVGLRKLVSSPINPPVQEIIDYGVIPIFLSFLDHPYPEFQYETLWCIINLCAEQADSLITLGGIQRIIKLLDTSIVELLNQAMWALGNLASNSISARNEIIELKAYDKIISILSTTNNSNVVKQCTYTISQFIKCQHGCPYELFHRALIYIIKSMFAFSQDIEFLSDALFFVLNMSEHYKPSITTILESEVVPVLFEVLKLDSYILQMSALRIIGNIATGDANQTQALIDFGVLAVLKMTINNSKKAIRKETTWIISNIAAGTQRQIESLIVENYLPILLEVIAKDDPEVQREAIWAVCNLTTIDKKDLMELIIKQEIIEVLCQCLKMKESKILAVALEALENILLFGRKYYMQNGQNLLVRRIEQLGMFEILENLQYHHVEIIYEKTLKLLETHFDVENNQ